jgi:hypothetical protein
MEQRDSGNLTNISFDEFISLIFERGMPPEAENWTLRFTTWVWNSMPEKYAPIMCNYFVIRSFWSRASQNHSLKMGSGQ